MAQPVCPGFVSGHNDRIVGLDGGGFVKNLALALAPSPPEHERATVTGRLRLLLGALALHVADWVLAGPVVAQVFAGQPTPQVRQGHAQCLGGHRRHKPYNVQPGGLLGVSQVGAENDPRLWHAAIRSVQEQGNIRIGRRPRGGLAEEIQVRGQHQPSHQRVHMARAEVDGCVCGVFVEPQPCGFQGRAVNGIACQFA